MVVQRGINSSLISLVVHSFFGDVVMEKGESYDGL